MSPNPSSPERRPFGGRICLSILLVASIVAAAAPTEAADTGVGSVAAILDGFVEIAVTDATIADLTATPTSSDPGPRAFSTSDGFTFSNGFTNTRGLLSLDITSAQDGSASSTKTVQGTTHTIADWIYILQDDQANFVTYETTGTFDADAASYTAPDGFTKDSQGTFAIRYYDKTAPADGGDGTVTVHWIYDAAQNLYRFDSTDKDFTAGAQQVNPQSKLDATSGYTYTAADNAYAVTGVAASGANYVPTVRLAWQLDFSTLGSLSRSAYLLIDFPSGTPTDTYSITTTATMAQLTG